MRKQLATFLTVVLLVSLGLTANAAVKPGTACKKLGQTRISSGKKYTCIKSGKKLVWDKGVVLMPSPKPTNSPTPAPSELPTQTQTPAPSPSPTPTPPKNFSDLQSNLAGISYFAWLEGNKKMSSNKQVNLNIVKFVGPHTKPLNLFSEKSIANAALFYSNFDQVKNLYVIQFNNEDISWAQTQFEKYQDQTWRSDFKQSAQNQCPDVRCRNAMAQINNSKDGILMMGESADLPLIESDGESEIIHFNGMAEVHEYTHTVQLKNSGVAEIGYLPPFFVEGLAVWTGNAVVNSNDYSKYLEFRKNDTFHLYQQKELYTKEWLTKFLNPNATFIKGNDNSLYWNQFENFRRYDIGELVMEMLVSLKGADSLMNIFAEIGKGNTFLAAFQNEYGISWADAVPHLVNALYNEIHS